jgi:hypothetical protein
MAGTMMPWRGSSWMTTWGWSFGKWGLDIISCGRTPLTVVLPTRVSELSRTPWHWQTMCWSTVGVSRGQAQDSWNSSDLEQGEFHSRSPGHLGIRKIWKRSESGTTGYMWGTILRGSINNVTPVQYTKVSTPWSTASWISITLGYYSAGSPRPMTRWGSNTTAYPTMLDFRKEIISGCIAQPGPEGGYWSCSYPWKALIRRSPHLLT